MVATIDQSGSGLLKFTSNVTGTGIGVKTLTLQGSTAGSGEIGGIISDGIGTVSVTKAGSDTWTLSGANTYTGTTTGERRHSLIIDSGASGTGRLANTSGITVNSGGTLLLASSSGSSTDRINDSATITLKGGTFNLGGRSEGAAGTTGVGALTNQHVNAGLRHTWHQQFDSVRRRRHTHSRGFPNPRLGRNGGQPERQ